MIGYMRYVIADWLFGYWWLVICYVWLRFMVDELWIMIAIWWLTICYCRLWLVIGYMWLVNDDWWLVIWLVVIGYLWFAIYDLCLSIDDWWFVNDDWWFVIGYLWLHIGYLWLVMNLRLVSCYLELVTGDGLIMRNYWWLVIWWLVIDDLVSVDCWVSIFHWCFVIGDLWLWLFIWLFVIYDWWWLICDCWFVIGDRWLVICGCRLIIVNCYWWWWLPLIIGYWWLAIGSRWVVNLWLVIVDWRLVIGDLCLTIEDEDWILFLLLVSGICYCWLVVIFYLGIHELWYIMD